MIELCLFSNNNILFSLIIKILLLTLRISFHVLFTNNKVSMIVGGVSYDAHGNPIDQMIPSAATIVELTEGPELTRKCDWKCWFYSAFLSVVLVISILFADELFRRKLSWSIQDAHLAEPSEWEIFSRYIGWTVLTVLAAIMYVTGLMI